MSTRDRRYTSVRSRAVVGERRVATPGWVAVATVIAAAAGGAALARFGSNQELASTAVRAVQPGAQASQASIGILAIGTLASSLIALAVASPIAVASALYASHLAPARLGAVLSRLIDLLAAVPSVVYGLWGLTVVSPLLARAPWPFAQDPGGPGPAHAAVVWASPIIAASAVLAVMLVPLVTSVSRRAFASVPSGSLDAALALGATRWKALMVSVVGPNKPTTAAALLTAFARALGEAVAVAMVVTGAGATIARVPSPGVLPRSTLAADLLAQLARGGAAGHSRLLIAAAVLALAAIMTTRVSRRLTGGSRQSAGVPDAGAGRLPAGRA
ncbi:MAG: PstC family ABC transporter permease [Acidimicrobiales bacterium]